LQTSVTVDRVRVGLPQGRPTSMRGRGGKVCKVLHVLHCAADGLFRRVDLCTDGRNVRPIPGATRRL
ncbi:MAG: hypothetical protein ACK559_09665, partial [bacterium]